MSRVKERTLRRAVGIEIQFYRQQKKMNQAELAVCAGCHVNTISSIERGQCATSIDIWFRIAECLKINPAELIPQNLRMLGAEMTKFCEMCGSLVPEDDVTLGRRIKIARVNLGLSARQFSQMIDMDANMLSRIENGERGNNLKVSTLRKLAETLGIPVTTVLGMIEE